MTTLMLLHSPLVGPLTWEFVAGALSETAPPFDIIVPDLRDVDGDPDRIADHVRVYDGPKVLAGHSGAGRRLPAIAAALDGVEQLIYVDADRPEPGQTWWDTAPAAMAAHVRGMERDGFVPRWHEWFPPAVIEAMLPMGDTREMFVEELRPVPMSFFDEPAPDVVWSGPTGFLLLSEAYRAAAEEARADGATVVEALDHHLAMLTDPMRVALALRELISS